MLYFVEGNLRYRREICTICGSRKLERLIQKIIETGDLCTIDVRTEDGVPSSGEIETLTGPGVQIKFVKVQDFPETEKKVIDFVNHILETQKK